MLSAGCWPRTIFPHCNIQRKYTLLFSMGDRKIGFHGFGTVPHRFPRFPECAWCMQARPMVKEGAEFVRKGEFVATRDSTVKSVKLPSVQVNVSTSITLWKGLLNVELIETIKTQKSIIHRFSGFIYRINISYKTVKNPCKSGTGRYLGYCKASTERVNGAHKSWINRFFF
jgi:hypothetical protein